MPNAPLGTVTGGRAPASSTPSRGPSVALVAGAGVPNHPKPEALTAAELVERIDRARTSGGSSVTEIASINVSMPDVIDAGRYLGQDSRLDTSVSNSERIEAVTAPQALTAAGICAPFRIDYSLDAIGTIDRPVRDSLPGFVADRGGVQLRRDVDPFATSPGGGPVAASGTWSLATDADPQSNTKPVWDVPCAAVISAEVQAITLGLKFSNITKKFDPEAVAANTRAATVAHSRYAETRLLNSMFAQTTATFVDKFRLGAVRDFLTSLDKSSAYMRYARRLGPGVPLRLIAPAWLLSALRADLVRTLHTANPEQLATADSRLEQWLAARGITPVWTPDGRLASDQPAGTGTGEELTLTTPVSQRYTPIIGSATMPTFPAKVEYLLYPEGAFVYLDGGSLDIGVVRDEALVKTNRYIEMRESFEGVVRKGVEAVRGLTEIKVRGGSAAAISTADLTD